MTHDRLLQRIGDRIRERCKELRLAQKELAGAEYTKSFVSQVKKGQTWSSLQALAHIAQRLGHPVEWFVAEKSLAPSPLDDAARAVGMEPEQARALLEELLRRL